MSDKKISQLSNAAALTGTEVAPIVQSGSTVKATTQNIANLALPSQTGNANRYLQTNGTTASWDAVNISTADVTGTLPIANGGTGQTTANTAINALLPTQSGQSGKYLTTDGTNTSWSTVSAGGTPTMILKISTDGMGGASFSFIQSLGGPPPVVLISGGIIFIGNTFTASSTVYAIPQMNFAQTAIWFPVQVTGAPAGFVGVGLYQENGTQIFMNSNKFNSPLITYIFP